MSSTYIYIYDDFPNIWKNKIHAPNHQPDIYIYIYIHIYIALYNHLTILWGPPSGLDATGGHVFGAILGGAVRQGTQAPGEEVDDRQLQPGTRAVVTIW